MTSVYTIHKIPVLTGGIASRAVGVNADGEVLAVGDMPNEGEADGSRVQRAFVWRKGQQPLVLPLASGMRESFGLAISRGPMVAGVAVHADGSEWQVVWDKYSAHPLAVQYIGFGMGINDKGSVVGCFNEQHSHAFLIKPKDSNADGIPDDWYEAPPSGIGNSLLIHLGEPNYATGEGGGIIDQATCINNTGTIGGFASWLPEPSAVIYNHPVETIIASAKFGTATAYGVGVSAINDLGQLAGFNRPYPNHEHAFFWSPFAVGSVPASTLVDLRPNGNVATAFALNDHAEIVGRAMFGNGWRAFRWNPFDATLFDLNSLLPVNTEWVLREAVGINNHGHIVGNGTYQGSPTGFLLRPGFSSIDQWWRKPPDRTSRVPRQLPMHILDGVVDDAPGNQLGPGGVEPVPGWDPAAMSIAQNRQIALAALEAIRARAGDAAGSWDRVIELIRSLDK